MIPFGWKGYRQQGAPTLKRLSSGLVAITPGLGIALTGAPWWSVLLVVVAVQGISFGAVCWLAKHSGAKRIRTLLITWEASAEPEPRNTASLELNQGVRDALDHVGTRCSQRPRQISAPAALKTSRTRCSSPRQRRSAQAPASWAIDCSTSARSPACRRLQAVVGPLGVAAPVDGAAVPDRCMPVRARLGQPPKPPVQQAWDLDAVQHPLQPRQREELVLVAATRPATIHPQQVTPDGRHRQALGGVGVPLGVVHNFLVGP